MKKKNQWKEDKMDKDAMPLVSAVMAVCNGKPEFIHEAVDSVLNQTYSNLELLIMDDSDEEPAIQAIDSYRSDSRVHIYREDHKAGFVPSLNKGLSLAKGDYIARMDADDVAYSERFEKQARYLHTHPDADILGGQIDIIDENGTVTGSRHYPLGGLKLAAFFLLRTPVAHPAVMFRRTIADAGYRYDESLKKAEDIDFWLRLYNDGYRIENIADVLVKFRIESGFLEKRVTNKLQEDYVLRIRRKNFSWKRPLFSAADWVLSYVRKAVPDSLKVKVYQRENIR